VIVCTHRGYALLLSASSTCQGLERGGQRPVFRGHRREGSAQLRSQQWPPYQGGHASKGRGGESEPLNSILFFPCSCRAWLTSCSALTLETHAARAEHYTWRTNWRNNTAGLLQLLWRCNAQGKEQALRASTAVTHANSRRRDVQPCVVTRDMSGAGNTHEQAWAGGGVHGSQGCVRGNGGGRSWRAGHARHDRHGACRVRHLQGLEVQRLQSNPRRCHHCRQVAAASTPRPRMPADPAVDPALSPC